MNTYVTSHTLLSRALDNKDPHAWEQFVERYRKYIFKLLNNLGVKNDIEDIAQEVILVLWKKLETYDRNQSKFRTWMAGVVRLTAINIIRKRARKEKLISNDTEGIIDSFPEETSYMEYAEKEWKTFLVNKAMNNIRDEFRGKAIEVFELSLTGAGTDEIAKKLDLTTSTVYTLKKRVKKRLMQEVYFLQNDMD